MGPWDIMSQHFVKQGEPPPGISSFTKIRLGWIRRDQVRIVQPGETTHVVLAPLSQGGELLTVKIPLDDGTHYLIENRQKTGFDKVLPDSGILILRVNPEATEGYGTVTVKSAGGERNFTQATYKLESANRDIFIDREHNLAVIPLWYQGTGLGVLITSSDRAESARKAAHALLPLAEAPTAKAGSEEEARRSAAFAAFIAGNYALSYTLAQQGATNLGNSPAMPVKQPLGTGQGP